MDKRIIIEGAKVHGVGFRPFLYGKARKLRLCRFEAENTWSGGKEVLDVSFGGDDNAVLAFMELCRTVCPPEAIVSCVREEKQPESVLPIDEYDRILASEQQGKIVRTGLAMLGKQDSTLGLQEKTIGLQERTLGLQEKTLGLQEKTIGLQEKTIESLDAFHKDTIQRFDTVDAKYGKIARNLERILEEMKEEKLEGRKSTERIISMISSMKTGSTLKEDKPVYGATKKAVRLNSARSRPPKRR